MEKPTNPQPNYIVEDVEYIKLSTSVRGVVTWDIKILGLDVEKVKQKQKELEEAFPRYPILSKDKDE